MPTRSSNVTPVPYRAGRTLQLQVLRSCCDLPFSQSVTALIRKTLSMTMSPVMEIAIKTRSGSEFRAVLKVYDRRFGRYLRELERRQHAPHTAADEVAFQSFVRQGRMAPFIDELEHNKKTDDIARRTCDYYDSTPEGPAKFEAALWHECVEHFECETETYARLEDLQGNLIPRMYAHVRIAPSSHDESAVVHVPADLLQSQTAESYFKVRGVLLQVIDGYRLWDIATSPGAAPADPTAWPAIIQAAVDAAHEINRRGVRMEDSAPRNVMVDARAQKPFIIDLAQCRFKDKMIKRWLRSGWTDGVDDWDPDVEYWEWVAQRDNPGAIAAIMRTQLRQQKGMELDVKLPDYDEIIMEIKRSKELDRQNTSWGTSWPMNGRT
ncbi:hypothetical protein C8A00DRAFT_45403 [Chaetomidium leptoderma]|uniref:Protein kinase domain-containing protein n=1 Tax=Chaetomidium leptoderma TaxID=669021 RepID=A0AAN6VH54_9PEZI|nr:hypothetical protein C8A00DRAFT_45403 [Chaetomidium leptoderma]